MCPKSKSLHFRLSPILFSNYSRRDALSTETLTPKRLVRSTGPLSKEPTVCTEAALSPPGGLLSDPNSESESEEEFSSQTERGKGRNNGALPLEGGTFYTPSGRQE